MITAEQWRDHLRPERGPPAQGRLLGPATALYDLRQIAFERATDREIHQLVGKAYK